MEILVIGGSYFLGRVFVMEAAKKHNITVVNRGTYRMEDFGVTQITGDRNDENLWQSVNKHYDALVDFCGYHQNDITTVLKNIAGSIGQYVFISTVDVYQRGLSGYKEEDTPLESRQFAGAEGEYITGKVALEKELQEQCIKRQIPFTILRPAILYGPFNYAPRESVFIQLMAQQGVLPSITDAEGCFQMLYVKDAAYGILQCLGNEKAYGKSYNLCGDETVTYGMLAEALYHGAIPLIQDSDTVIQQLPMKVQEAMAQGLPLPFPVTKEEMELYSNQRSRKELNITYTSLTEGIARTCKAFWGVYYADNK